MTELKTTQAPAGKGRLIAILAMFFLFAMISFVTNLAAPIGTIWGERFSGNYFLGMLGNLMNFLAYLFMGVPASLMLLRIGYKKTALAAIAVGIVGLLVMILGGSNFVIYLLGAFIGGFCVCMLNTVVNPLLNLLGGGGNRGNQLLQAGGSLNSLAATLPPLLVGSMVGELTKDTSISSVAPLMWIAIGVFAVSFIGLSFVKIPEPHLDRQKADGVRHTPRYKHSPLSFRHTVLGVIGIFIYVGIEVSIPGTLNMYLSSTKADGAHLVGEASKIAGAIVAVYWLLMLVGRMLSSMISGIVSSKKQLIIVSAVGMALVIGAILIPQDVRLAVPEFVYSATDEAGNIIRPEVPVSAYLLIICGLCTSVMWGGIFNLAVEGLGKYTAQASGIFMTMVVGGGVIPVVQQLIVPSTGFMPSYWIIVACLGYLLFYGLVGSKNVNTDIPVEEEADEINAEKAIEDAL